MSGIYVLSFLIFQSYRDLKEVTPEGLQMVKKNFEWVAERVEVNLSCLMYFSPRKFCFRKKKSERVHCFSFFPMTFKEGSTLKKMSQLNYPHWDTGTPCHETGQSASHILLGNLESFLPCPLQGNLTFPTHLSVATQRPQQEYRIGTPCDIKMSL